MIDTSTPIRATNPTNAINVSIRLCKDLHWISIWFGTPKISHTNVKCVRILQSNEIIWKYISIRITWRPLLYRMSKMTSRKSGNLSKRNVWIGLSVNMATDVLMAQSGKMLSLGIWKPVSLCLTFSILIC